ncbi:MAG: hypothetical protein MZU97_23540 [Bacillus subtilis]|nr:hypothetical protein [Bacillus subtilis]
MPKQKKYDSIEVVWTKIVIYTVILAVCFVFVILAPKQVFQDRLSFRLAASMAITTEDNLILYDYKVFATEEIFQRRLAEEIAATKEGFFERNEIVAVMIYGESETLEVREDYLFLTSPDTPELNIEYYLVKSLSVNDIELPCRSFIMLFNDLSTLVNNIYIALFTVFFVLIMAPLSIKIARNVGLLKQFRASQTNDSI